MINWLRHGDHKILPYYGKHKNIISYLEQLKGITYESSCIKDEFQSYFSKLLGSSSHHNIQIDWKNIYQDGTINLSSLEYPLSKEKIRDVMFIMSTNKSPAPDGYPAIFFREFWFLIKKDLCKLFEAIRDGTMDIDRLNYSHIILIAKRLSCGTVKDFRPITLMNEVLNFFLKC